VTDTPLLLNSRVNGHENRKKEATDKRTKRSIEALGAKAKNKAWQCLVQDLHLGWSLAVLVNPLTITVVARLSKGRKIEL